MNNTIFDILAKGQTPRSLGLLEKPTSFSAIFNAPAAYDGSSVPLKLSGTKLAIPDYLMQFQEFIERSLADYLDNDFSRDYQHTAARILISQRHLDKNEPSIVKHAHLDTDYIEAVHGKRKVEDLYLASDIAEMTTRFFTSPVIFAPEEIKSIKKLPSSSLNKRFSYTLQSQCEASEIIDAQAYEIIHIENTQPHSARTLPDREVFRTFAALILKQAPINTSSAEANGSLRVKNKALFDELLAQQEKPPALQNGQAMTLHSLGLL